MPNKMIDLEWCLAKLNAAENRLIFASPASVEADTYIPAGSMHIQGRSNLIALRDALNEAYPVER